MTTLDTADRLNTASAAFEAQLRADGFTEITLKQGTPEYLSTPHTHPFGVRALVLSGEFTLTKEGVAHTYRAGETFSMDAHCSHSESFGPLGSTYVIGRKYPQA